MAEYFPEGIFCHRLPFGSGEVQQLGDGGELRFARGGREAVPGAYILTGVATEEPVVELILHVRRDQLLFQFDGKIRDTLAAIDHLIIEDGVGGTGVYTLTAGAAIILRKRIVVYQRQVGDEGGDEEERTRLFGKQVAVAANPPDTAFLRPGPFQHGSRIDKTSSLHFADLQSDVGEEAVELFADHFMIVFAIGIFGNLQRVGILLFGRVIIEQQGDHRLSTRHQPGRIDPQFEVIFHIPHGTMHALLQPVFEAPGIFVQTLRPGDATIVESQLAGQ